MVELRSDAMLYSILGNENSDAGPYQLSTRAAFGPWAEDTRPCYIASWFAFMVIVNTFRFSLPHPSQTTNAASACVLHYSNSRPQSLLKENINILTGSIQYLNQ